MKKNRLSAIIKAYGGAWESAPYEDNMTREEFFSLKNGTDVRGTAIEGVENDPVTLTDEAVTKIAKAFCTWVFAKTGTLPTIAVGYDSRLSAKRIERLVSEGITSLGGNVILTGLSSTPSMFMLLKSDFGANASIMITASHLPYQKNGLKFFLPNGGLEGSDVAEILNLAAEENFLPASKGEIVEKSYLEEYANDLVKKVRTACGENTPLSGKRILVDAGNGAGGFYVDKVLKPLGADTTGSQFLEPDGRFPNHVPNPENAVAMKSVCDAVKANRADFGIIFDTDVDRAGAVAPNGEEINRNGLIALISAILLEERRPAYIVTDSVTSDGLAQFIKAHGGVHHRFKRGYKNVINESKRLNAEGKYSPLAIETSGHAALEENYFLDDGAYLVTRLLISLAKCAKQGKELCDLIADLPKPFEAAEIRLNFVAGVDFKRLGAEVIEEIKRAVEKDETLSLAPDNYEGVRINFNAEHGDGWALVRMSLHEPILPINVESNRAGGNAIIVNKLVQLLDKYDFIDLTKLKNF